MAQLVKLRIEEAAQPAPEETAPAAAHTTPPASGAVPGPTSPAKAAGEQPGGELRLLINIEGRLG
jgi:hypothetical protein